MSFPKFEKKILKNKIKILLVPIKDVKTTSVSVTINSGYVEEKNNEIGIAHFLEHMIARHLRDGEFTKKIRKKGVIVVTNAYTSPYRTSYYAYGDAKYSIDILKLVLDTYNYREINQEIFEQERTAVIVEMKNKLSKKNIVGKIYDLPIMMYGKSTKIKSDPLRHIEVVSKANESDLIRFMNNNYLPDRTTITISGNFNKERCLKIIDTFSKNLDTNNLKKTKKLTRELVQVKKGIFPKIKFISDPSKKVTHLSINFLIFNCYQYQNKYMAILLENILSRIGDKSILFDRLRSKLGVTYSPHADTETTPYYGLFEISMDIEYKNLDKTIKECAKILKELKTKKVENNLIKLAKSRVLLDIKNKLYNINPVKYLDYTNKFINNEEVINPQVQYDKYIKNITPKDIQKISKLMFKKSNCYMLLIGQNKTNNNKLRKIFNDNF